MYLGSQRENAELQEAKLHCSLADKVKLQWLSWANKILICFILSSLHLIFHQIKHFRKDRVILSHFSASNCFKQTSTGTFYVLALCSSAWCRRPRQPSACLWRWPWQHINDHQQKMKKRAVSNRIWHNFTLTSVSVSVGINDVWMCICMCVCVCVCVEGEAVGFVRVSVC